MRGLVGSFLISMSFFNLNKESLSDLAGLSLGKQTRFSLIYLTMENA